MAIFFAAILVFQNFKLLTVRRLNRVEMRRHAKFGQNRSKCGGDMAVFRFFKMAAAAILDFQNFKLLTVRRLNRVEMRRRANFGRNRSKCGGDMTIFRFFKMAAAAILDFFTFQTFNGRTAQEGRNASLCQIWSKSVKPWRRYDNFSIFQDGGRRRLAFLIFEVLMIEQLKRVKMRRCAKSVSYTHLTLPTNREV